MTEFQHFIKLFLSEAGAGLNHKVTVTDWFSFLDQAASQRDRAKGNKYKSASVGQPRSAQEALTCFQGNFSNSATAKSLQAAVPLSVTQLRVGVSLLCLHLIQQFAEHISACEVSMTSTVSPLGFCSCFRLPPRQYLEAGGAHGDGGVGQQGAVELPAQRPRPALDQHIPAAQGEQHSSGHHHGHELRASLLQGKRAGHCC